MPGVAAEARGSGRFLQALQFSELYVLALKSGGDEAAYQKLVHREGGEVVSPLFSSWAAATTFIRQCGVEDTEQFVIIPAREFVMSYELGKTRLFLNPKTEYQRELWPEEALAWCKRP